MTKIKEKESEQELFALIEKAEQSTQDFSLLIPQEILTSIFGHEEFKPQQLEIINRVLAKEGNTLGIMPTGGGKSLCFQIPALILPNITLVISPLIALMKDQMDSLTKKKIYSSFCINSTISQKAKDRIFDLIKRKKVKILYIAPESLKSEKVLNAIQELKIDLFVIDEAHCISGWGHDFRPDYLRLSSVIKQLNNSLVLALTATATKDVEQDIQKQLGLECKVFKSSFDRSLLYMGVTQIAENSDKELFLCTLLKKLYGPSIIYVTLTETAEKLAEYLSKKGFSCTYYHGQIKDIPEKEKKQNAFISGQCTIIISTIAFGMGIDKSNIRNIIHFNCSQSIENYYQEIGRSGRDGQKASCITLYSKNDIVKIKKLKERDWPNEEKVQNVLSYFKNKNTEYIFTSSKIIEYECEVQEIAVKLILQRLEECGAVKIYSGVLAQIQIEKPLKRSTIEILKTSGEYANDLEKIFLSNYFKNPRKQWLIFEDIMQETNLSYFRLKEIFFFLKQNKDIHILNETNKDLVLRNQKIHEFDISPLVILFQSILDRNLKKVDQLTDCLLSTACIRKNILAYFGEEYKEENCHMCSNCMRDDLIIDIPIMPNEGYLSDEEIERISMSIKIDAKNDEMEMTVLKCMILDSVVPKKDFVKILTGNLTKVNSTWKFELSSYNMLSQFKEKKNELENCIESLLKEKYIQEGIDGSLRVTKRGVGKLNLP